jgi:hypothetical protein
MIHKPAYMSLLRSPLVLILTHPTTLVVRTVQIGYKARRRSNVHVISFGRALKLEP